MQHRALPVLQALLYEITTHKNILHLSWCRRKARIESGLMRGCRVNSPASLAQVMRLTIYGEVALGHITKTTCETNVFKENVQLVIQRDKLLIRCHWPAGLVACSSQWAIANVQACSMHIVLFSNWLGITDHKPERCGHRTRHVTGGHQGQTWGTGGNHMSAALSQVTTTLCHLPTRW